MLKPSYLTSVASDVVDIMSVADAEICSEIASVVTTTKYPATRSAWQKERAKLMADFKGDVDTILASATKQSRREIKRIMKQSGEIALSFDNAIYLAVGLEPATIAQNPALQAVLLQGVDKSMDLMKNLTKTTATAANKSFITLMDRAFLQIMSGAYDTNTAIRMVVNMLAEQGVEKIAYPSGSYDSIESATRRAVITGINQSIAKLQLAQMDVMGCDLVETTSHPGARPTHAVWQGKVYCRKGRKGKYEDFVDATGYGSGDGLCGWNCYHSFFPFFEGYSTKAISHDPSADRGSTNDKDYEEQQKLRYYERRVREAKKSCVVHNAAMLAADTDSKRAMLREDFDAAAVILKRREAALKSYLEEIGRTADGNRVMVAGYNRSVSSKAVWGNRRKSK